MGVEKCPGCTALVRVYARREVKHDPGCKFDKPMPCHAIMSSTRWHACQLPMGHEGPHKDTRPDSKLTWPDLHWEQVHRRKLITEHQEQP